MSKLKSFMEDWLDDCGHELGYDIGNLPDLRYLSWINYIIQEVLLYLNV